MGLLVVICAALLLIVGVLWGLKRRRAASHIAADATTHLASDDSRKVLQHLLDPELIPKLKVRMLRDIHHNVLGKASIVQGLSEILLTLDLDETKKHKYLTSINKTSKGYIADITLYENIAKMEIQQYEVERSKCALASLFDERLAEFRNTPDNADIHIDFRHQGAEVALLDHERFVLMLDRLLAICRHSIQAPPAARISIESDSFQTVVCCIVSAELIPLSALQNREKLEQCLYEQKSVDYRENALSLILLDKVVRSHSGTFSLNFSENKTVTLTCSLRH